MSARLQVPNNVRADIVRRYDGTTETINALCAQYGMKRHNVTRIAKEGGYISTKVRGTWTEADDEFLRENWHKLSPEKVAEKLGRTVTSCVLRKKRIGIGRYDGPDLNILDVEKITKIDHRLWHDFIERGWLKVWRRERSKGATPFTFVAVDDLKRFLIEHPEVFDYGTSKGYAHALIEADSLPTPPRYKLVTCQSTAWTDGKRLNICGPKVNHGEIELTEIEHRYSMASCAASGGVDFWVPTYEVSPHCPRCGCKVSRFSDRNLYRDDDPGDGETIEILAAKIGLRFVEGEFLDDEGNRVTQAELLQYVFSTKRQPGKAVRTFQKLLQKGLTVVGHNPVPDERLLPNLLSYSLRPLQEDVTTEFFASGALSVAYWPGFGKMFVAAYLMTVLAGDHVLFTHNHTVRDQWLKHLARYAPHIEVTQQWKPSRQRVRIYDAAGALRSTIWMYSYLSRAELAEKFVLAVYDEAHWLPGNHAHRKSLVDCEYRLGLSATPYREDGRADMIGMLSGRTVGEDWQAAVDDGTLAKIPVTALIVDDLDHKHDVLQQLLEEDLRTIVFSDAIADGEEISRRCGIPFIFSKTNSRIDIVRDNRTVCMSRVGDCGLDVPDLQRVIEFSFHGGGRAQSAQRVGRLLHSVEAVEHIVLMTRHEFERFEKRLQVLRHKGFEVTVKVAPAAARLKPICDAEETANMGIWAPLFGLPTHAARSGAARRINEPLN